MWARTGQLLLNGVGLMSFWLHDEMIAVDLLESLPNVDRHNLGERAVSILESARVD
jgi:hypothetical protein